VLQAGDTSAVEVLMSRCDDEPVADDWQQRYKGGSQAYWDQFYRERTVNFFKDRNYLREEFGELMPADVAADPRRWVEKLASIDNQLETLSAVHSVLSRYTVLLEVGCAVGNGAIPVLRANPDLFALACDLSPVAVKLLQEKEEYKCGRCFAFPSDISHGPESQPTSEHISLEDAVPPRSVDHVTMIFVLSAIDPALYTDVFARLWRCLRPGGIVLFRDYGRGDLAQLRFAAGHWLGGDLYVRGDGTLAFFFSVEHLAVQFEEAGFEVLECEYRRTEITNRGTGLRMPRVWVQGKFRRPS